jgi:hypothetical protein
MKHNLDQHALIKLIILQYVKYLTLKEEDLILPVSIDIMYRNQRTETK